MDVCFVRADGVTHITIPIMKKENVLGQVVFAALRKEHLDCLNHTLTVGQHTCFTKLWEDDSSREDGDGATYYTRLKKH